MEIAVLGSGSWGTALSLILARNGHAVHLFGRNPSELRDLRDHHVNSRYLPGVTLPDTISIHEFGDPLTAETAVLAVPAGEIADALAHTKGEAATCVIASKGLDPVSGKLPADMVRDRWATTRVAVLSAPNLATEIARGIPTVAISASDHAEVADAIRDAFSNPTFRVSTSADVVGVELAGALKNVLAIGAGASDGLGFGDNTKGALLSRGLMEMCRLGLAMGAQMDTFLGPAGVGDLFATAASGLSRNYRLGRALAEGQDLVTALQTLGQVAEGVTTAQAALVLADRYGVEVPVMAAIHAVIQCQITPSQAVSMLMDRSAVRYKS